MKTMRVLLATGILLLLVGCGNGGADVVVEMHDDFFEPDTIEIEPGDSVTFRNEGQTDHTAEALDGSWELESVLASGDEETVVIEEAGEYHFFCRFHSTTAGEGMDGTLVVGDAPTDEPDDEEPDEDG